MKKNALCGNIRSFLFILQLLVLFLAMVSSLTTPPPAKVAVIGATGRLGRTAVQQLVQQNIPCRILLRQLPAEDVKVPTSIDDTSSKDQVAAYLASLPHMEVVEGDVVTRPESLNKLLQDCTACLALFGATRRSRLSDIWKSPMDDPSHAKQVNYVGVQHVVKAMLSSKTCRRVVRITGKGETPNSIFSILINLLGGMAKAWNYQGELVLREAAQQHPNDFEYTIVRPGVMSQQGPPSSSSYSLCLADNGGDLKVSPISYSDVASLCVESLRYPQAKNCTLTAMTTQDTTTAHQTWGPLLEQVQADRRVFPTDMFQRHVDAVRGAVIKLGVFTTVFVAVLVQFLVSRWWG